MYSVNVKTVWFIIYVSCSVFSSILLYFLVYKIINSWLRWLLCIEVVVALLKIILTWRFESFKCVFSVFADLFTQFNEIQFTFICLWFELFVMNIANNPGHLKLKFQASFMCWRTTGLKWQQITREQYMSEV